MSAGQASVVSQSYPCLVVGLAAEDRAAYVKQHVREGDGIVLHRQDGDREAITCFHKAHCIGHVPEGFNWVSQLLGLDVRHVATVSGFENGENGILSAIEIKIALSGEAAPGETCIRSIISEIGDEIRILAMVALADGRIARPERALLGRFVEARARELGLDVHEDEVDHAIRWAGRNAADSLDAARIIGSLAVERPAVLPLILEECEHMAEVDGMVGREEQQTVTTLRNLLEHALEMAKQRAD